MKNSAQAPAEVLVVGSLSADLFVHGPRLPRPGETVIGQLFTTDNGGKGANQAVAAARMGAQVAIIGRVGRDPHGKRIRSALREEGIAHGAVGQDRGQATGVASIMVGEAGENCIVVIPGANGMLAAHHVADCHAKFAAARVVVVQLEIPMPTASCALTLGRQAGALTLLNAAPAANLSEAQLIAVDWLVVNTEEATEMLRAPVRSPEHARLAAEALRRRGIKHVVITLGADGLVFVSEGISVHLDAPKAQAIDTTGAGDTFVGALAAGLAFGLHAPMALRLGQAAAALAVERRGTQLAIPTRRQVLSRWPDLSASLANRLPL